jgi:hypothetical protein
LVEAGSFMTFTVPASTGVHDSAFVGDGPDGPSAGTSGIEITLIDEYRVEGLVDAGAGQSGGFVLDACGHFGQTLVSLEPCELTEDLDPTALAISPEGRIAVSDFDRITRVFQRTTNGNGCVYELDATYGSGGVIELGSLVRQLAFDDAERLYAADDGSAFQSGTTGSLIRVAPGAAIESCLNDTAPSAGVTDSAPDRMSVLRDGSVAYAYWPGGERRIDLSSPAVGPSHDVACVYETSVDAELRYAGALSVHSDGFLFLRALDVIEGPTHAEFTDLALEPKLRFGGTTSGRGIEGFLETGAGCRCPVGYCMASPMGLAMYSEQGELKHFVQWYAALAGRTPQRAVAATEGQSGDAYVLLQDSKGLLGVRVAALLGR